MPQASQRPRHHHRALNTLVRDGEADAKSCDATVEPNGSGAGPSNTHARSAGWTGWKHLFWEARDLAVPTMLVLDAQTDVWRPHQSPSAVAPVPSQCSSEERRLDVVGEARGHAVVVGLLLGGGMAAMTSQCSMIMPSARLMRNIRKGGGDARHRAVQPFADGQHKVALAEHGVDLGVADDVASAEVGAEPGQETSLPSAISGLCWIYVSPMTSSSTEMLPWTSACETSLYAVFWLARVTAGSEVPA